MGINFQNVSFKYSPYSSKALNDINLSINETGELIFIVGKTGSGKSTITQHMNALLLPTSGDISILDNNVVRHHKSIIRFNTSKNKIKYDINKKGLFIKTSKPIYSKKLKQIRNNVGLVFQFPEYQLFESTVLKDVMFGPLNFGYSAEVAKQLAVEALLTTGIDRSLFGLSPFELSGGQMRRVSIATILACNPKVIIFDEPTVGLDPKGKEELIDLINKIRKETNKTIIIVSHDMDIVAENATRVIVVNSGEIAFDGNAHDLFKDKEFLNNQSLDLPNISKIAINLKEKGLINYKELPIKEKELIDIIKGGNSNE